MERGKLSIGRKPGQSVYLLWENDQQISIESTGRGVFQISAPGLVKITIVEGQKSTIATSRGAVVIIALRRHVSIDAPLEIQVMRGELLERSAA